MNRITSLLLESWLDREGNVTPLPEILNWMEARNRGLTVHIEKVDFSYNGFWHYDEEDGYIRNDDNSFFQLAGYQEIENSHIVAEQPIILQNEIGYLGILARVIGGRLNFLMQAKIEPGNLNVIQISPAIQATKSNFTRRHGGRAPDYLDYFVNASHYTILADQLQSEQSSRFYQKRNRNMIILVPVDADVPVLPSHRWMTLGQIKELLKRDNLVNMDTRTVLSCLPFFPEGADAAELEALASRVRDPALLASLLKDPDRPEIRRIFFDLNECKMYRRDKCRLLPLRSLKGWRLGKKEIACRTPYDFKIIYCRIEIEGREVKYWEQPLVEALGISVIGTFTRVKDGVRQYLARVRPELGCFDSAELGPLMQLEPTNPRNSIGPLEALFLKHLEEKRGVLCDVLLSEEGGRFYHEQNRNVLLQADPEELGPLPQGFFWLDHATLAEMIQFNNCVNIQLRNLMALVDL